ncbi:MAG: HAD family hydrolase [Candidatus Nanopelagicales bacterium]
MTGLPSAGPYDLVIFDHDGVLVDSEIIAMDLCARLLTEHGVPTTVDEAINVYLGGSLDAVMDAIESDGAVIDRQAFDTRFHEELFDGFRQGLQAIPGIRTLLEQLAAAGIPFVIASSGSSQRVNLGITTTNLVEFFPEDVITTRDHVERGKPFPDLFILAAKRAGTEPARCLVIEDSPHGIEAAHRAGMQVVGLSHRTPVARLAAADWIVTDAADILPLILVP